MFNNNTLYKRKTNKFLYSLFLSLLSTISATSTTSTTSNKQLVQVSFLKGADKVIFNKDRTYGAMKHKKTLTIFYIEKEKNFWTRKSIKKWFLKDYKGGAFAFCQKKTNKFFYIDNKNNLKYILLSLSSDNKIKIQSGTFPKKDKNYKLPENMEKVTRLIVHDNQIAYRQSKSLSGDLFGVIVITQGTENKKNTTNSSSSYFKCSKKNIRDWNYIPTKDNTVGTIVMLPTDGEKGVLVYEYDNTKGQKLVNTFDDNHYRNKNYRYERVIVTQDRNNNNRTFIFTHPQNRQVFELKKEKKKWNFKKRCGSYEIRDKQKGTEVSVTKPNLTAPVSKKDVQNAIPYQKKNDKQPYIEEVLYLPHLEGFIVIGRIIKKRRDVIFLNIATTKEKNKHRTGSLFANNDEDYPYMCILSSWEEEELKVLKKHKDGTFLLSLSDNLSKESKESQEGSVFSGTLRSETTPEPSKTKPGQELGQELKSSSMDKSPKNEILKTKNKNNDTIGGTTGNGTSYTHTQTDENVELSSSMDKSTENKKLNAKSKNGTTKNGITTIGNDTSDTNGDNIENVGIKRKLGNSLSNSLGSIKDFSTTQGDAKKEGASLSQNKTFIFFIVIIILAILYKIVFKKNTDNMDDYYDDLDDFIDRYYENEGSY